MMEFFTKTTYMELIPVLTLEQLNRESGRHLKAAKQSESSQKSIEAKRNYLLKRAEKLKDGLHIDAIVETAVSNSCQTIVQLITEELKNNAILIQDCQAKLDSCKLTDYSAQLTSISDGITNMSQNGVPTFIEMDSQPEDSVLNLLKKVVDHTNESDRSIDDLFSPPPQEEPKINKILILSDSRNLTFDTESLRSNRDCNIICKTKSMYHMKHIIRHEEDIINSDIVIISCGVNDIIKWNSFGKEVAEFLIQFVEKVKTRNPQVRFLFSSIMPTSIDSHLNNAYLRHIDMINASIFEYTINSSNIKVFDNLQYQWNHLAQDGIHLTPRGRASLSDSWILAVTSTVDVGSQFYGSLPIRPRFTKIMNEKLAYMCYNL